MVEFLVSENAEPQGDEVRMRLEDPSPSDVEGALRSPEEVWYGTHFVLRGGGINMLAISTTGPFIKPDEPGEFLLYSGGSLTKERADRHEVIRAFVAALS